MRCPQCASEIPENNALCPNCGSPSRSLTSQDRALGARVFHSEGTQPGHPPELSLTQEQQQFLQKLYTHKVNVTYLIIAINLFLFLLLELNGGSKNSHTLIEFGARYNPSITEGQYWRLLTNTFLHAGYLHIIFNMYGLFNLGSIIERLYGPTRFLFLYLLSGIVGSVISWQASPYLSVGAVFGIAGVMIVYGYKHKKTIPREMTANFGKGAIPFVALNLYLGFSHPQIDNYAHIGGLLAGMLLSALMNPTEERAITERLGQTRPWTNLAMQATSIGLLLYGSIPAIRNYRPQKRLHQAEVSFQDGTRLIQQGKLDQAVAEFKKAIAINPNSAQFHLGLGSAYLSLGQTEEAIREYEQSLQIRPNAPEAQFYLGIAWNRQGATDNAIAAYQEAIRLKPDLVPAYFDLGVLYLNTQHASSAEQLFQQLLKAKPFGESHLVIGQAYLRANRDELAIEHFRKAVEMKIKDFKRFY